MARKGVNVDAQRLYPIYPSQTAMNLTYIPEYDAEYCDVHRTNLLSSFTLERNRPLLVILCFGAIELSQLRAQRFLIWNNVDDFNNIILIILINYFVGGVISAI